VTTRTDTVSRPAEQTGTHRGERWQSLLMGLVTDIPDRLAVWFFWGTFAVAATLFLRIFNPYLVIALTLVLIAATWRFAPNRIHADQRSALGSIVAIEVVLGWVWVNAPYYTEMLTVYRDPSIYALRGWWLTTHSSPVIDVSHALQGTSRVFGAVPSAGGFPAIGHTVYPQGASLVPGLIAVAGRVGGLRVMLGANLLLAGVALLLFYALARRLMGPLLALVPMIALALSMPMVYFARAAYTEPTALAAVSGGLLILWSAFETRRYTLFVLAGAMVGVSTLARVDGVLAVVGGVFGIGIAAAGARSRETRSRLRWSLIAFSAGGLLTSLAGWYDLTHNSPSYYSSLASDMHALFKLFAVVFVAAMLLSWVSLGRLRGWLSDRRGGLGRAAVITVLVICAVMASRPLWWVARLDTNPAGLLSTSHRQRGAGLPIDPRRSYDEHTVTWLAWYLTWPVVILAAIGLALLLLRVVRERDSRVLAFFATFGVVSAFYLNDVSIGPDQIWATRRLLPVIIPGVLLAAGFTVARLARNQRLMWVAGPLAVLVALAPALQWRRVFMQAEFGGELNAVNQACSAVDRGEAASPDRLVIFAGPVPATGFWSPTLQIICRSTVVSIRNPTPQDLVHIRSNWGNKPVTVITFGETYLQWAAGAPPPPQFSGSVVIWNQSLVARPAATTSIGVTFWAGVLGPDGKVSPLP
jgi:hypothetical protein